MWVRQLAWIEPVAAAARLAGEPRLAWLDSAMAHPTLGRYSYIAADPFGTLVVRGDTAYWNGRPQPEAPLTALRRRMAQYKLDRRDDLPSFQGGAIGVIAYEFGWSLEGRRSPVGGQGDDMHLAFHDVVLAFDHERELCWLIATGFPETHARAREARAQARLAHFAELLAAPAATPAPLRDAVHWRADSSRAVYGAGVERVKTYIRDGDIYQANIARRFTADAPAGVDALDLYRTLRAANPAPYGAFLDCGGRKILSTSPELFLRSDGRTVETRPIKGTARRDPQSGADREVAARLLASCKDRAENVMIVDLLRNDLAKVCVPTSVEVPVLCGLETYAGLHHLVSAVTGELAPGQDTLDLLAATFPGGSITGAPKIRAMEIISEIEGAPRGTYCGAIGALGFDGALDLNIAIRTVTIENGQMELRTGGGITILSDAQVEYEETLTKGRRIFEAFAPARAMAEAPA